MRCTAPTSASTARLCAARPGWAPPIALQDLLVSVSFLIILAIVNAMGVTASAGVGVAEKVCAFIMLISSAFMQSISAFVAQNYGAGCMDRARKALHYGAAVSFVIGVGMFFLTYFHGDLLAGIFSSDAEVIAAAADYLRAYAIDCLFTSIFFCYTGYYNGIGQTRFVMLQGIAGAFGVRAGVLPHQPHRQRHAVPYWSCDAAVLHRPAVPLPGLYGVFEAEKTRLCEE